MQQGLVVGLSASEHLYAIESGGRTSAVRCDAHAGPWLATQIPALSA